MDPYSSKDGVDGVAFYVSKYVLKFDDWVDRFKSKLFFSLDTDTYKEAWKTLRPRLLMSKGFGSFTDPDVVAHLTKGIKMALDTPSAMYPYFISRVDGSTFPLSPYYAKKYLTPDSMLIFRSRRPDTDELTRIDVDDFDKSVDKFKSIQSYLNSITTEFDLDMDNTNTQYFDYGKIDPTVNTDKVFADSWKDFVDFDYSDD